MIGQALPRYRGAIPRITGIGSYFTPASGTPGGNSNAALTFMSGLGGMGAASADYSIAPNASIDPRFAEGRPGIYVIRMIVEAVDLEKPTIQLHDTKPYNDAIQAQGIDATVTRVRYAGQRNPRDMNWAGSILHDVLGTGKPGNVVADMMFDVTVTVRGMKSSVRSPGSPRESMSGLGAAQIGAGAVFAVVAVIAIVLAVTFPGFGKMVLEGVTFVGAAAGTAVGGAASAVASNAVPLLIAVGVAAGAIWLLKKSGARYSKGGGFSFGG